jgi:hypothetical protein
LNPESPNICFLPTNLNGFNMIFKKVWISSTVGLVAIVSGIGIWLFQSNVKIKTLQLRGKDRETTEKEDLLRRLIMKMQQNMVGSENSDQFEADIKLDVTQREEDEQQWQVLNEKRQARIEGIRAQRKRIEAAIAAGEQALKEQIEE